MKQIITLALASLILCSTALAGDLPYLTTALVKRYHSTNNYQTQELDVVVRVLTDANVEPADRRGSLLYALKFHTMLCEAFERLGWRKTDPLSAKLDAGTLELTFEPRMKGVVMKTFVYPCDSQRLWNMMKYRGGSKDKYFDRVVEKTQTCIEEKQRFR
jgi:hypothetical protein